MGAEFPLSGAQYVVRPTVVEACGLRLGIVPFSRGRLKEPLPECDVLLTHVPPKGILDKCYNGDRAGSRFLHEAVCASFTKPRLWVCGHIHEGYGYEVVKFGSETCPPTLVVNAANANAGRANRLIRAPVIVDIPRAAPPANPSASAASTATAGAGAAVSEGAATAAALAGRAAEDAERELRLQVSGGGGLASGFDSGFGSAEAAAQTPRSELRLLAVDLGLRTGMALYDGDGALLSYAQYPVGRRAQPWEACRRLARWGGGR